MKSTLKKKVSLKKMLSTIHLNSFQHLIPKHSYMFTTLCKHDLHDKIYHALLKDPENLQHSLVFYISKIIENLTQNKVFLCKKILKQNK